MRTPEEIKKGLECCIDGDCDSCPYYEAKKDCGDRLKLDALAYIQQLEESQQRFVDIVHKLSEQVPEWISVEERLPESETEVLVWLRHIPNIAVYGHDKYGNLDFYYIDECGYRGTFRPAVTHWMPLPEPPKESACE